MTQAVWLLVLMTSGSLNIAPTPFASKADCDAVAVQIPKGNGGGRCVTATILIDKR